MAPGLTLGSQSLQSPWAGVQPSPSMSLLGSVTLHPGPPLEPPSGIADAFDELPFYEGMHVLVWTRDPRRIGRAALQDFGQRAGDGARILRRQDPRSEQRVGPRQTPTHIVLEQATVEWERGTKLENRGVGRRVEPARPERRHVQAFAGGTTGASA